jgi:hypothetical protein
MANRMNIPDVWSLYKGLTVVRARILMSGTTPVLQKYTYPTLNSGALGSYATATSSGAGAGGFGDAAGTEGVLSVTRTDVGLWTFVLQDNYQRLMDLDVYQSLAGGLSTITHIGENTTITSLGTAGGSTIGVALMSSTGTAADPATTTGVTITMLLQNSTVG